MEELAFSSSSASPLSLSLRSSHPAPHSPSSPRAHTQKKNKSPSEPTSAAAVSSPPGNRIDGDGLSRESPFAPRSAEGSWLSESQVEFFTGGGIGETGGGVGGGSGDASSSSSTSSVVTRRLVFGGLAAAGAAAFALVPTDALRLGGSRPQKPLFFYLTPLVRAGPLLDEAVKAGEEAEWPKLASILSKIQGSPCDVEQNLRAAAAHPSIPAPQRAKLQEIARDAIEYVASIDYNSYFESVGGTGLKGGTREKAFADFSSKAATAAKAKIQVLLEAMPRDDYEAARSQVEALAASSI